MTRTFSRFFKIVQAETDTALTRLEDPVKLSERGVRDLKRSLSEATMSLAQVKSVALRTRKEAQEEGRRAEALEQKAALLLRKAQRGELASDKADQLASDALRLKEAAEGRRGSLEASAEQQEQLAEKLQSRIATLRRDVRQHESELTMLRARRATARSVRDINRHLAGAEGSDTVAMLERMREKVMVEEALAEAYEEIYDAPSDSDAERDIDEALLGSTPQASGSLAELKARLGIEQGS